MSSIHGMPQNMSENFPLISQAQVKKIKERITNWVRKQDPRYIKITQTICIVGMILAASAGIYLGWHIIGNIETLSSATARGMCDGWFIGVFLSSTLIAGIIALPFYVPYALTENKMVKEKQKQIDDMLNEKLQQIQERRDALSDDFIQLNKKKDDYNLLVAQAKRLSMKDISENLQEIYLAVNPAWKELIQFLDAKIDIEENRINQLINFLNTNLDRGLSYQNKINQRSQEVRAFI